MILLLTWAPIGLLALLGAALVATMLYALAMLLVAGWWFAVFTVERLRGLA